jgi:Protein of unknown function (DUF4031)
MEVYIDSMNAPYRGMKMCHMMADSTEELLEMADKIGVQRKWLQSKGTPREHFDICQAKKAKALNLGAEQVGFRKIGELCSREEVLKTKKKLSYEVWLVQNEDEINIELVENGADRELDFNPEREFDIRYEKYLKS